jgi:hypothetical protein
MVSQRIPVRYFVAALLFSIIVSASSTALAASDATWHATALMAQPRQWLATTGGPCPTPNTGRSCVYALGGDDNGVLSSAEVFDPTTDSWSGMPSMSTGRIFFAAAAPCETAVSRTCIYAVAGDDSSGNPLASMEMYDPSTNNWTSLVASLPATRDSLAAAEGPCPTPNTTRSCLYAIGGNPNGGAPATSVEVYDPSSNGWSAVGSMNDARSSLELRRHRARFRTQGQSQSPFAPRVAHFKPWDTATVSGPRLALLLQFAVGRVWLPVILQART